MFIYKITNHVNGKVYIGQSVRPVEERWNRHKIDAISGRLDTHFARAIRKYGVDNFSIEVIDTAKTQAELTLKEHYWIGYYNAVNTGYMKQMQCSSVEGILILARLPKRLK